MPERARVAMTGGSRMLLCAGNITADVVEHGLAAASRGARMSFGDRAVDMRSPSGACGGEVRHG
jgi:hypothetical protein